MYAVIQTGGKQYRVSPGQVLRLEKIEVEQGGDVKFEQVLMVADGDKVQIGKPYVSGASVNASVMSQGRAKKIEILKFKRRKQYMKHQGHRQYYTEVKIKDIQAS